MLIGAPFPGPSKPPGPLLLSQSPLGKSGRTKFLGEIVHREGAPRQGQSTAGIRLLSALEESCDTGQFPDDWGQGQWLLFWPNSGWRALDSRWQVLAPLGQRAWHSHPGQGGVGWVVAGWPPGHSQNCCSLSGGGQRDGGSFQAMWKAGGQRWNPPLSSLPGALVGSGSVWSVSCTAPWIACAPQWHCSHSNRCPSLPCGQFVLNSTNQVILVNQPITCEQEQPAELH